MRCIHCGSDHTDHARFCPGCGERIALREPVAVAANGRPPVAFPREEMDAALAARHELGSRMEPEVVDAFLARVEQAIDARVDARVSRYQRGPFPRRSASRARNFTGRIAASLGIGIPLTGVAAGMSDINGAVGGLAVVSVWATIVILNIYYTEVEKEITLKRGD